MNVERRVFGNVAILGTGEFIAQFANFGFVVLIARAFGPELLGHYSFSMAVSAIVIVLSLIQILRCRRRFSIVDIGGRRIIKKKFFKR